MNITREEIGTLNEVLKISIMPEDYTRIFETELKKVQKSVNMPGFRPGHVPAGLVKKKYGKAILLDEMNKLISGTLEKFITQEKLDLLGSPIPQPSDDTINNWDEPGTFEFAFEIGLAPDFELTLPPAKTFDYYEIIAEDDKVKLYIDDVRRKYGKFSNPEVSDEHSILYGDFTELDGDHNVKDGGITSKSTLAVGAIKNEDIKNKFKGLKKGDVITINLNEAFRGDKEEIAHMLNIPAERAESVTSEFNYTIDTVNHVELADLNQEFFDKIFAPGTVTSEEELKEKVRAEISGMYARESDMKLKHDIEDSLLAELNIQLPDSFLRKWLQTAVEKPLTPEQVEKEYNGYSRGMKLRIIENRIFREQQLNISQDEIKDMARQYILHQFSGYSAGLTDEIMDSLVNRYLEKKESVERIIETLSDQKVFNYLKSIVKTKNIQVTYDKFKEIVENHHH